MHGADALAGLCREIRVPLDPMPAPERDRRAAGAGRVAESALRVVGPDGVVVAVHYDQSRRLGIPNPRPPASLGTTAEANHAQAVYLQRPPHSPFPSIHALPLPPARRAAAGGAIT